MQFDFIRESDERTIELAAKFQITMNQVLDIQNGVEMRGTTNFKLGRGPGTQAGVDEVLYGNHTPLGPISFASGFRVEVIDGKEVKIPWGPEGNRYIKNWEALHEAN